MARQQSDFGADGEVRALPLNTPSHADRDKKRGWNDPPKVQCDQPFFSFPPFFFVLLLLHTYHRHFVTGFNAQWTGHGHDAGTDSCCGAAAYHFAIPVQRPNCHGYERELKTIIACLFFFLLTSNLAAVVGDASAATVAPETASSSADAKVAGGLAAMAAGAAAAIPAECAIMAADFSAAISACRADTNQAFNKKLDGIELKLISLYQRIGQGLVCGLPFGNLPKLTPNLSILLVMAAGRPAGASVWRLCGAAEARR